MVLFRRLNTGGIMLNPQELRNALYPSEFSGEIKKLARSAVFTRVWGIPAYSPREEEAPPMNSHEIRFIRRWRTANWYFGSSLLERRLPKISGGR